MSSNNVTSHFVHTLSGLTAVHSKVCGFVGLQASLLHTWAMNLHVLWVTAFSNGHLRNVKLHIVKLRTESFWRTVVLIKL